MYIVLCYQTHGRRKGKWYLSLYYSGDPGYEEKRARFSSATTQSPAIKKKRREGKAVFPSATEEDS